MPHTLIQYIRHPETMDRNSLFGLRALVDRYPYFQVARLLYLRNLYQLHDPTFGDELQKTAISLSDCRKLYQMVDEVNAREPKVQKGGVGRTGELIDGFLSDLPDSRPRRAATPVDASTDYIGYLMQHGGAAVPDITTRQLIGSEQIDKFIQRPGRITLPEITQYEPELSEEQDTNSEGDGVFTETLARIYIKQGRYFKAIEIIRRLSLNYPKKSRYFADQIRFLEKLIVNNQTKN